MALVTDNFRIYAAESFRDTLQSTNKVYMFVGRAKTWGSTDVPPTGEPIDSFEYARTSYGDSVAFKRVDISDTALVVPRVDWVDPTKTTGGVGRTYSMYKPDYAPTKTTANGSSRLYDSNFYVMNSDFNVYKCLYNGQTPEFPRGRPSLVEPTGTSTTIIETADSADYSYRWKYLYTIDADNILKFVTSEFIPVLSNSLVKSAANSGSVDTVVIENAGSGYNNGTFTNVPIRGDYNVNNGTQALCTVIVVSGSVSSVTITQAGSGYSFASIDVSLIPNIGSGTDANLDVVLPPNGGHGFDSVRELGAYRLMFASKLETTSAFVDFPNDLTYRRVGLVLNPTDYNTTTICSQNTRSAVKAMILPQGNDAGAPTGDFAPGETITQATTNAKGLVVSYDAITKVLKYYQDSVDGTVNGDIIPFSGQNQITGSVNSYIATPDNTQGTASVPVTQIQIGVSVYELGLSFVEGYANEEIELNSGEILYLDNRIPITRSADQNEELKVVIEF